MINLDEIIYKVYCDGESGTGFLVSKNKIITAFHVIQEYDNKDISILKNGVKICSAKLSSNITDKYKKLDVAVLHLSISVPFNCSTQIALVESINPGTNWKTRGYPACKPTHGDNLNIHNDNVVNQVLSALKNNKINVELEHQKKYLSYQGFSGAPLVIEEKIVGIINTESKQQKSSFELGALLLQEIKQLLISEDIPYKKIPSLPLLSKNNTNPDGMGSPEQLNSALAPLISSIIPKYKPWYESKSKHSKIVDLQEKLLYNEVFDMAQSYIQRSNFMSIVETAVDEIDSEEPESREIFLWAIKEAYDESKIALFKEYEVNSMNKEDCIKCIRDNSSKIIEMIYSKFQRFVDIRLVSNQENFASVVHLIICYGIINCKVFEIPDDEWRKLNVIK